jgi:hypothetical protein
MRRLLFLLLACLGLLCAYGYGLVYVTGYAAALPIPRRGFLWWGALLDTLVLVLISLPVALLVSRFGGRRATAVALMMTVALFAATVLPSLIEDISRGAFAGFRTPMRLYIAFGYLELIAVLPLLVWLLRKLPSNKRWSGPRRARAHAP